jgi:hypothetical protein
LLLGELGVDAGVGEAVAPHREATGDQQHHDDEETTETGQDVENFAAHEMPFVDEGCLAGVG